VPSQSTSKKELDIELGGDIISMPALKKAYDKDAMIFRLLNNTPNSVESFIKVNGQRLTLNFGKYEVKTVVYENGVLTESYELLI
jgi:hypothetical protein